MHFQAIIKLMPYSFFKKIGKSNEESIKTNITINSVGGGELIGAKVVASMELTVGWKTLATAFFVVEMQGNYSVILGWDWIHANYCVSSTLHQFLIQWFGDVVEIVHTDTSTCVVIANSPVWKQDDVQCFLGLDSSDYDFLSVSKIGFVSVNVKSIESRLNHTSNLECL
jgi:hypothetical protein